MEVDFPKNILQKINEMSRSTHKDMFPSPSHGGVWGRGGNVEKVFFAKYCMRCVDLHRKSL